MTTPHTRLAVMADVPALCALLDQLFAQEVEFTPDAACQRRGLEMVLAHPDAGFIEVITEGERILGMVNVLYTVSTALGARVAILEDMIIDRSARGRSLGTRLLDAALERARANGCERITLLTDGDNAPAHRFYERHGFTRSTMVAFRLTPGAASS